MTHAEQIARLSSELVAFSKKHGPNLADSMEAAAGYLLAWQGYLEKYALTGVADELLRGTSSMVRETVAFVAIGAARPALFSLRAQMDLMLGWLYFRDHPVEYRLVHGSGEGFKLKREIIVYMRESYPKYSEKIGVLNQIISRKELDPYRFLSAHVHAQSELLAPRIDDLKDVVGGISPLQECVKIQSDVSEFLSDNLFASGLFDCLSLPKMITEQIKQRTISPEQKALLFS